MAVRIVSSSTGGNRCGFIQCRDKNSLFIGKCLHTFLENSVWCLTDFSLRQIHLFAQIPKQLHTKPSATRSEAAQVSGRRCFPQGVASAWRLCRQVNRKLLDLCSFSREQTKRDTSMFPRLSSSSSLPPLEDDADSVCSDELLGSQSRLWLSGLTRGPSSSGDVYVAGRDGLFVDQYFPVGELELQPAVQWKRPRVKPKADFTHMPGLNFIQLIPTFAQTHADKFTSNPLHSFWKLPLQVTVVIDAYIQCRALLFK